MATIAGDFLHSALSKNTPTDKTRVQVVSKNVSYIFVLRNIKRYISTIKYSIIFYTMIYNIHRVHTHITYLSLLNDKNWLYELC